MLLVKRIFQVQYFNDSCYWVTKTNYKNKKEFYHKRWSKAVNKKVVTILAYSHELSHLFSGPFSKSAVNFNAGCRTAMSNIVMALCMMLTLLFLAPLFSYTPLVALSAIIMSAMLGLIDYEEAYRLFKVDKFDFCICMAAFLGVAFISMDIGLMLSVFINFFRWLKCLIISHNVLISLFGLSFNIF